jgi:hypothetical protein
MKLHNWCIDNNDPTLPEVLGTPIDDPGGLASDLETLTEKLAVITADARRRRQRRRQHSSAARRDRRRLPTGPDSVQEQLLRHGTPANQLGCNNIPVTGRHPKVPDPAETPSSQSLFYEVMLHLTRSLEHAQSMGERYVGMNERERRATIMRYLNEQQWFRPCQHPKDAPSRRD